MWSQSLKIIVRFCGPCRSCPSAERTSWPYLLRRVGQPAHKAVARMISGKYSMWEFPGMKSEFWGFHDKPAFSGSLGHTGARPSWIPYTFICVCIYIHIHIWYRPPTKTYLANGPTHWYILTYIYICEPYINTHNCQLCYIPCWGAAAVLSSQTFNIDPVWPAAVVFWQGPGYCFQIQDPHWNGKTLLNQCRAHCLILHSKLDCTSTQLSPI